MRKNAKERERHYERMNIAARDAPPRARLLRREEYIYKKRVRWRREREREKNARKREQKHIEKKRKRRTHVNVFSGGVLQKIRHPRLKHFLLKGKREVRQKRRRRRSIGSAPFYSSRARVKFIVYLGNTRKISRQKKRRTDSYTKHAKKKTVTHFYSYCAGLLSKLLFHVCDSRRVLLLFLLPSMSRPAVSSSSSSRISSLFVPGAARRRKRDQDGERRRIYAITPE